MKNIIKIILAAASAVLIAIMLFFWHHNKKYPVPNPLDNPSQVMTIGEENDYYRLTIPTQLGASKSGNSVSFHDILYPEMKPWTTEARKRGTMISFVRVSYNAANLGRRNTRDYSLEEGIKRHSSLSKPTDQISKKLTKKYPGIKVYTDNKTKEISHYVFSDKNGFLVAASVLGKVNTNSTKNEEARVYASYKGKFEIEFPLREEFFYDMADITDSVIDLVSSFNPSHYQTSSDTLSQTDINKN